MNKGVRFSIQVLFAGDGYFVGWGAMHWFYTIPDVPYYSIGACGNIMTPLCMHY